MTDLSNEAALARRIDDELAAGSGSAVYRSILLREAAALLRATPTPDAVAEAVSAETEQCARIAERWKSGLVPGEQGRLHGHLEARRDIAAAIRQPRSEGGAWA